MQKIKFFLLSAVLLCTACGKTPAVLEELPRESETAEQISAVSETEDHVLLTLEAPLTDGRTLTLEAVGKALNEYDCGVREVRVYDGETLLQTVSVREAIKSVWGIGMTDDFYNYTECWSPEDSMEVLDLNLDGNTDFGLFGWSPNNTIPYYYWQWDGEQYQYAFLLQGVKVHPETGEVCSEYKEGYNGIYYQYDYYRPDGEGNLYLDRQERSCMDFENLDYNRGFAAETWIPKEGAVIRPPWSNEQYKDELVLVRREIPVYEVQADNTASYFTEIWELQDGQLELTSREEYVYDD